MWKQSLSKNGSTTIQPIAGLDKEVRTCPKGISPKMNVIV